MSKYLWNVLILIDQALNAILGPLLNLLLKPGAARFGDPDETLSSVFGKNIQAGECSGCKLICRALNWFEPNHCIASIETTAGGRAD